jgi:hypothetical protein
MDPSDDEDVIFPEDGDLIDAVYEGDLEKVKKLLDEGEDINAKDDYGRTPLHYASINGDLDIIKFLVEKGANVNAKDDYGRTPLHYASIYGIVDVVKFLVKEGANVNARDEYGSTPLHYAAPKGYLDVVKFLVEKGADINAKNKDGKTPLDLVMDIVDFLEMVGKVTAEIIDVKHSPLYEGFWGRIFVLIRERGKVKIDLEGDVDWIDPGEIIINGEDTVEIPVKPKVHGEVPVKITVKGGGRPTSKIVWLNVANIQKKSEVASIEKWVEGEIERVKGFLREIEES